MRKSTFICKFKILDISQQLSSLWQNLEDERHITETFHILLERALIEGCEKNSRNQKMINLNSYLFMNLNFRKKYIRTNIDSQVT